MTARSAGPVPWGWVPYRGYRTCATPDCRRLVPLPAMQGRPPTHCNWHQLNRPRASRRPKKAA